MKRTALLVLITVACGQQPREQATASAPPADPRLEQGKTAIVQYGCNVCHVIPGIQGGGTLGPTLAGLASRPTISEGAVQNTPANLAQFIQEPASMNPQSSMPPIGITDAESEAITGYLMTLK